MNNIKIRLIGKKFNLLTVVEFGGYAPGRKTKWVCICECGNTKTVRNDCLVKGTTKSCGCLMNKGRTNNLSRSWGGHGEISLSLFHKIKNDAIKRNLEFSISIENIWDKFLEQKRTCALSGLPIEFCHRKTCKDRTASLDRIDSSKGYTLDNIQWVHRDVNIMKWDFQENHFIKMCKIISQYNARVA